MPATYPSAIPDLSTSTYYGNPWGTARLIATQDELQAVMDTLGTNPQANQGTVGAFLQMLQAAISSGASYQGLTIANNAAAPNSKVDVVAAMLGLETQIATNVSFTLDMTVNGLGGFDNLAADAEDADTWYHIWAGKNPTTGASSGCFSKASTKVGLILTHASFSGYTAWRRVGAVRNNGSSNFLQFFQQGARIYYRTTSASDYTISCTNTPAGGTVQTMDVKKFVPPTSRVVHLMATLGALNVSQTNQTLEIFPHGAGSGWGLPFTSNHPLLSGAIFDQEVDSAQLFDAKWTGFSGGTGTGGGNRIDFWARGYVDVI